MKKYTLLNVFILLNIEFMLSANLHASSYLTETFAGVDPGTEAAATATYSGDGGAAVAAAFRSPQGVFVDTASTPNVYVADTNNNVVRMISGSTGNISTIAGLCPGTGSAATAGYSGDGAVATAALLSSPGGVCVDGSGNVYIADTENNVIRMIWNAASAGAYTQGYIYTIVGSCPGDGSAATPGYYGDGVAATSATLHSPRGVCLDSAGNVYIADTSNNVIRMLWNAASAGGYTQGNIYTIAGTGATPGYSGDTGLATSATLCIPSCVFVDTSNNIYVADTNNHVIREFTLGGTISTIAGSHAAGYSGDGAAATSANLSLPYGVFVSGTTGYIADTSNNVIREFSIGGNINTLVGTCPGTNGTATANYIGDGGLATNAFLNYPRAICADGSGNLYIADTNNNVIRELLPVSGTSTFTVTAGISPETASTGDAYASIVLNGGYTLVLPAGNQIGSATITDGILQISTAKAVTFDTGSNTDGNPSPAATLEVTSSTNTGQLIFTTAGTMQVDDSCIANFDVAPTGSAPITKTGNGTLKVQIGIGAAPAIDVQGGTLLLSNGGVLPTAGVTLASGATLGIEGSGNSIPSVTAVSGSTIDVNANATVSGTFSGGLTVPAGATLKLGNGSTFADNVTVS